MAAPAPPPPGSSSPHKQLAVGKLYQTKPGEFVEAWLIDLVSNRRTKYETWVKHPELILAVEPAIFPQLENIHYAVRGKNRGRTGFIFLTESGRIWIDEACFEGLIEQ